MVHLVGLKEIKSVFRVSKDEVKKWIQEGAPIYLVGKTYQCVFESLWSWIEQTKKSKFSKAVNRSY